MSICGYNEKIGSGLQTLVEGMVEALEKKAETASVTEVLDREMVELETMIGVMQQAHGAALPEMFVGLNILAKALFEQVRRNLEITKSDQLGAECRLIGQSFVDLLSETEQRYEQLRTTDATTSVAESAKQLAEWVLEQSPRFQSNLVLTSNP